jgi:hypothetical protein
MADAKLAWDLLAESTGSFQGRGINHEGQAFLGEFKLETVLPGKLLSVSSSATGDDGELYHKEVSWIGRDISGVLQLYVSSNNHPAITPHAFHRIEETRDAKHVIFRFGNPDLRDTFREEITFSFYREGSVAHLYAWGMPGGNFEPRSGSKMKRI